MNRAQLTATKHAARHSRIAHLLRTTCPYCHAPAGEPCRAKSGTPIWDIGQIHAASTAATANLPSETGRNQPARTSHQQRAGATGPLKMLAPQRPLAQSLVLGAMVIGIMAVGGVVLYAVTGWLWLVVHQGLH